MGITAEKVAEQWKVTREDQDAFALASHQKALAAIAAGEFRDEITPYEVVSHQPDLAGNTIRLKKRWSRHDEGPRPDTTPKAWRSCGRCSATASRRQRHRRQQLADVRRRRRRAAGVRAGDQGLRPDAARALRRLLGRRRAARRSWASARSRRSRRRSKQAGLTQDQLDWIELNEAFAAQALAVIRDVRPRPGEGQSARRRDRARPSARRDRRGAHGDASCTACAGASRSTAW